MESVNVLAIDGGGVRGLSSLLILRQIMERLKNEVKSEGVLLPCQIFDVICGASTGGLIAIMLGRLRMSVDDAIMHYRGLCREVFGRPTLFGCLRKIGFNIPMYNASILENSMKRIVAQSTTTNGDGEAPLKDQFAGSTGFCHTFVVAIQQSQADAPPVLFRSYTPTSLVEPSVDKCKIWESARATTATAEFFKPAEVGIPPNQYLDANLLANNPSKLACQEVRELFSDRPIGCFLSLGTGYQEIVSVKGHLFKIANSCRKLAKNCEGVANEVGAGFRMQFEEKGLQNPFCRFSVNRGLEDIKLDEWDRESKLTGITGGYMRYQEQERAAKRCVEALTPKAQWVMRQNELL